MVKGKTGRKSKQAEKKAPQTAEFVPSKYQQALFDWIQTGTGSAVVEAVAGSGKTTTIVRALELIPLSKRAIFLAFNRSIAEELKSRVPGHATAATFHSVGLRTWRRAYPSCMVDEYKLRSVARTIVPLGLQPEFESPVCELVSLARQAGIGCVMEDLTETWELLIDHFDVQINGDTEEARQQAIMYARSVLAECVTQAPYSIDFDDMIYMPVLRRVKPYQYDWVFIDEAQDTNHVRRELAKMLLSPGGRMVAVGDRHQAIYGFTGADADAMELIERDFHCRTFPLSVCYRSTRAVVREAKSMVPEIEPAEFADEGLVDTTSFAKVEPGDYDAILCRNTAPLVNLAYELIADGKGCRILGRNIGRGLVKLIESMKCSGIIDLSAKLSEYRERQVAKLTREGKTYRAQSVEDKVDCIFAVMSHLSDPFIGQGQTIQCLIEHIEGIFQDDGGSLLTLSTVHKAKGLEWQRVFFYMPSLIPSKYAKQPWQQRQEANLRYVAITRAKKELYYVKG